MNSPEIFILMHRQSALHISEFDTLDEAFAYRLKMYREKIYAREELSIIARPAWFGEGLYT